MISQERLKQLFSYNPISGEWTRAEGNKGRYKKKNGYLGHRRSDGYLFLFAERKMYMAHRLAFLYMTGQLPPKNMEVDHINRDRSDNRFSNLRIVTREQNRKNRQQGASKTNQTGYVGVQKNRDKWAANLILGSFNTPEEANAARLAAREKLGLGRL